MADRLVSLSANPTARRIVTSLGLPIPMPEPLARDAAPWRERELADRVVVVGAGPRPELLSPVADTLARAGADPHLVGIDADPFEAAGEAWGRPPVVLAADASPEQRPHGLVFDATGLRTPAELRTLYDFFHPRVRGIEKSGRVVVIGRPHGEHKDPAAAAAQRALEGFVRSMGRELGRKGATALFVTVASGADDRLPAALRFALSRRSVYVSGQVLRLTKSVRATEPRYARPLDGKVALVTGAARGIGAATARALAREGAKVIVLDRPADDGPASAVASEVGGVPLLVDLTDDDAPAEVAAFVKERFGAVDVVVHNAGVTRDKTLAKMKPEWWDQAIDVNLDAVLRLNDALEPLLASHARVVCLSSIAGLAGNVGQTNYATSKAGIVGFVEALSGRLARRGIAVNAVAPGFIETRLTDAIPVATREVARRLSNLSQGGLPEDVAEAITFLSSPGASGLSGQVLRVCGGNFVGA